MTKARPDASPLPGCSGVHGLQERPDPGPGIPKPGPIYLTSTGEKRTIFQSDSLPEHMKRPLWKMSDFDLMRQLYRSSNSLVVMAVDRHTGMDVVLKLYLKAKLVALTRYQVEREIRIHSTLSHPSIIQMLAAFENSKHVVLVLEWASGGDLYSELDRRGGKFDEQRAVRGVVGPFLQAIAYLHSKDIIHRDIKPENILLTASSAAGSVKLADFGLSVDCSLERPVTRGGTLDYMAPEVLLCHNKARPEDYKDKTQLVYTPKVDVWAIGVLSYELLTGRPPFEHESRTLTVDNIMYQRLLFPPGVSAEAKDFIAAALSKSARKRPSVFELLHHPWILAHAAPAIAPACAPAARAAAASPSSPTSVFSPERHSCPAASLSTLAALLPGGGFPLGAEGGSPGGFETAASVSSGTSSTCSLLAHAHGSGGGAPTSRLLASSLSCCGPGSSSTYAAAAAEDAAAAAQARSGGQERGEQAELLSPSAPPLANADNQPVGPDTPPPTPPEGATAAHAHAASDPAARAAAAAAAPGTGLLSRLPHQPAAMPAAPAASVSSPALALSQGASPTGGGAAAAGRPARLPLSLSLKLARTGEAAVPPPPQALTFTAATMAGAASLMSPRASPSPRPLERIMEHLQPAAAATTAAAAAAAPWPLLVPRAGNASGDDRRARRQQAPPPPPSAAALLGKDAPLRTVLSLPAAARQPLGLLPAQQTTSVTTARPGSPAGKPPTPTAAWGTPHTHTAPAAHAHPNPRSQAVWIQQPPHHLSHPDHPVSTVQSAAEQAQQQSRQPSSPQQQPAGGGFVHVPSRDGARVMHLPRLQMHFWGGGGAGGSAAGSACVLSPTAAAAGPLSNNAVSSPVSPWSVAGETPPTTCSSSCANHPNHLNHHNRPGGGSGPHSSSASSSLRSANAAFLARLHSAEGSSTLGASPPFPCAPPAPTSPSPRPSPSSAPHPPAHPPAPSLSPSVRSPFAPAPDAPPRRPSSEPLHSSTPPAAATSTPTAAATAATEASPQSLSSRLAAGLLPKLFSLGERIKGVCSPKANPVPKAGTGLSAKSPAKGSPFSAT